MKDLHLVMTLRNVRIVKGRDGEQKEEHKNQEMW